MEDRETSSALSSADVPTQGDHSGVTAGDRLHFRPGAFLSIFMECKRSFFVLFWFFL
ncbi:hypothetical protein ACRRTK_016363 [Alexandromys fortis]